MQAFKNLQEISFPNPHNISINMMPIIIGDINSLPYNVRQYNYFINKCNLKQGDKAYLTITESFVSAGATQRRGGIHTDATSQIGWGGGWGGIGEQEGIYLASTDGRCKIWDCLEYNVDHQGSLQNSIGAPSVIMDTNTLYWMTDRTPHQALPSKHNSYRQFFRVVSNKIGTWWAQHSTPSPFGILPDAAIELGNKFESED